MKTALFAGLAIALAAGASRAAETPVSMPAFGPAGIAAPTPLTPQPLPPSTAVPLVSPIPPSRSLSLAYPGRYPTTLYSLHHPHWMVKVFGN